MISTNEYRPNGRSGFRDFVELVYPRFTQTIVKTEMLDVVIYLQENSSFEITHPISAETVGQSD